MEDQKLIIEKKKLSPGLLTVFLSFVFLMFLIAGITGLIQNAYKFNLEFYFSLLFIALSLWGIKKLVWSWGKLFSNSPEFEIDGYGLIVYDTLPRYSKIPFSDITGCDIFRVREEMKIGIFLKSDSSVEGNITKRQRSVFDVPHEVHDVVILRLDFTDIDPYKFKDIINDRINK